MRNLLGTVSAYFKKTDRILWFFTITATIFGFITLISMKYSMDWTWSKVGIVTQVGAASIGFLGALILSNIDYIDIQRLWKIYTIAGYGIVVIMYIFRHQIVTEVMGNYNWIQIPLGGGRTLSLQPSEFLKLVFILDFAQHISQVKEHINRPLTLFFLLLHAAIPAALIHLLGDDGTAIVFLLVAAIMLICNGLSWVYIVIAITIVLIALPLAWQLDIIKDYQKTRIMAIYRPDLLDPKTLENERYQLNQGLLSMGIGGVSGGGFVLEKPYNVVYMLNDFIFTYIGQYAGFLGCTMVIVILSGICFKCLSDGRKSVRNSGRSIAIGIFSMFTVQICINLGMCLGVLPVIGLPLPFFSQGGTSMLVNWLAIGLVQSVYMHNDSLLFKLHK